MTGRLGMHRQGLRVQRRKGDRPPLGPVGSGPLPDSVVVARSADDLEPYVTELEALAGNACIRNVFYEPWVMLPLVRAFAGSQHLVFLLIFEPEDKAAARRLAGFFPFERAPFHRVLPLPCLRLWQDPFLYFRPCSPLVRKGSALFCIGALLEWLRHNRSAPQLLDLPGLAGRTEITAALEHALATDRNLTRIRTFQESHLYRRCSDVDAYFGSVLSSERRQTLRRKGRHLARLGQVEYRDLDNCPDVDALLDAFIELEASGWKGAAGTAIASRPSHRAVIKGILREAHERRRLSLLGLWLDGRLIAARSTLLAPPASFLFKIAFDESENIARCSPGLLLELEGIRRLHSDRELLGAGIQWFDSCAAPTSNLFRITRSEAGTLERHIVALGGGMAAWMVALLPPMRKLRSKARLLYRQPAALQHAIPALGRSLATLLSGRGGVRR